MLIPTRKSLWDIILEKLGWNKPTDANTGGAYINEQTQQSVPIGTPSLGYNAQGEKISNGVTSLDNFSQPTKQNLIQNDISTTSQTSFSTNPLTQNNTFTTTQPIKSSIQSNPLPFSTNKTYINSYTQQSVPIETFDQNNNIQEKDLNQSSNYPITLPKIITSAVNIVKQNIPSFQSSENIVAPQQSFSQSTTQTTTQPNIFTSLAKRIEKSNQLSQEAAQAFRNLPPLEQIRQVTGFIFDTPIKFIASAIEAPKIAQDILNNKPEGGIITLPKWLRFFASQDKITSFQKDALNLKQQVDTSLQQFPGLSASQREKISNGISLGLTALQVLLSGVYTKWLGEQGAQYLQSFAPSEEHLAAWATLGYPETLQEAKTNYYNLAHEFRDEYIGGGDNAKIINKAYEVLENQGIPDHNIISTTLGKIGTVLLSPPSQATNILTGVPIGQVTRTEGLLPSRAGYIPTQPYQPTPQVIPVGLSIKSQPVSPEEPIQHVVHNLPENIQNLIGKTSADGFTIQSIIPVAEGYEAKIISPSKQVITTIINSNNIDNLINTYNPPKLRTISPIEKQIAQLTYQLDNAKNPTEQAIIQTKIDKLQKQLDTETAKPEAKPVITPEINPPSEITPAVQKEAVEEGVNQKVSNIPEVTPIEQNKAIEEPIKNIPSETPLSETLQNKPSLQEPSPKIVNTPQEAQQDTINTIEQQRAQFVDAWNKSSEAMKTFLKSKSDLIEKNWNYLSAKFNQLAKESTTIDEYFQGMQKIGVNKVVGDLYSPELAQIFNNDVIEGAFNVLKNSNLKPFEFLNAVEGLNQLLVGQVPTPYTVKILNKVFNTDLTPSIKERYVLSPKQKALTAFGQIYNLSRSIKAGFFDFSAYFTQMTMAVVSHPGMALKSLGDSIKIFAQTLANPIVQNLALEEMTNDPDYFILSKKAGIAFTNPAGEVSERYQEPFLSMLTLEKIPILNRIMGATSNAFDTAMNEMKFMLGKQQLNILREAGITDEESLKIMGREVNAITGRTNIPSQLGGIKLVLSQGLFSARTLLAVGDTINPQLYIKLPPPLRKEMAKTWLAYLAFVLSIIFGSRLLGAEDTTRDPTSADFLKVKIGNYRLSPFGKYQSFIVLLARLIKGYTTSSTTGTQSNINIGYGQQNRLDIIMNFFESREHPTLAYIRDWIRGYSEPGVPFQVGPATFELFAPMFLADFTDIVRESAKTNWNLLGTSLATIFSFLGAPTQVYGHYAPIIQIDKDTGKKTLKLVQYPELSKVLWSHITHTPISSIPIEDWDYIVNKYRADQIRNYLTQQKNALNQKVANGVLTPEKALQSYLAIKNKLKFPQTSLYNIPANDKSLQEYNRLFDKGNNVPTLEFVYNDYIPVQELAEYNKKLDHMRYEALSKVVNAPRYNEFSDTGKALLITEAVDNAEKIVKETYIIYRLKQLPRSQWGTELGQMKKSGFLTKSIYNELFGK